MSRPRKCPQELLDRGARLVFESGRPIAQVPTDLGISSEALRRHVSQAQADSGARPDLPTSEEREEIRQLKRENFELRRANEILKSASVFCQGARSRPSVVSRYVDENRGRFGVERICRTVGVSASAHYQRAKTRPWRSSPA